MDKYKGDVICTVKSICFTSRCNSAGITERNSCQVLVDLLSSIRVLGTLEILSSNEVLDSLLNQGDVGLESTREHGDNLGDETVMRKFLASPVVGLVTIYSRTIGFVVHTS